MFVYPSQTSPGNAGWKNGDRSYRHLYGAQSPPDTGYILVSGTMPMSAWQLPAMAIDKIVHPLVASPCTRSSQKLSGRLHVECASLDLARHSAGLFLNRVTWISL